MTLTPTTRNHEVELLAPAGNREALEAVVEAGADAVYLGGKKHNMRMFRADLNFDAQGLAEAVAYTHARGVRLFVTVNNLYLDSELPGVLEHVRLLETLGVDALIVQDLGLARLLRREGVSLPLHASVMVNSHNAPMLEELASLGISRCVLGREVSLAEASRLRAETGMELEYFIHGDMCLAQSGQCYASGLVFGESSNRGRCMKPCRWKYRLVDEVTGAELHPDGAAGGPTPVPGPHLLAIKDMCMLGHLPELIQSGIYSFKIEGRMRPAEFLRPIVRAYRQAIDAYLADPSGYRLPTGLLADLRERRARDLSTCYALAHPGRGGVGYTGEREPKFFSTGAKESALDPGDLTASPFVGWAPAGGVWRESAATAGTTAALPPGRPGKPHLSVRVATLAAVGLAAQQGADLIYVGGEEVHPGATAWTLAALREAVARAGKVPVVVATPRITARREIADLARLLGGLSGTGVAGVMGANPGLLRLARVTGLPVFADFGLNALNSETVSLLAEWGVCLATGEPEASFRQLAGLAQRSVLPLEVIAHGPLPAMVLEHCVPAAVLGDQTAQQPCPGFCRGRELALEDIHGQRRPLRCDQYCRNHLYLANDTCTLPYLGDFVRAGFSGLRIEGQLYDDALVGRLVAAYRTRLDQAIAAEETGTPLAALGGAEWADLAGASPRPLGLGAYTRGITEQ